MTKWSDGRLQYKYLFCTYNVRTKSDHEIRPVDIWCELKLGTYQQMPN